MPGLEEEMIVPKKKRFIPSLEIEAGGQIVPGN